MTAVIQAIETPAAPPLLEQLQLRQAAAVLPSWLARAAEQELSYADFLAGLLEDELVARQRGDPARLRQADFPFAATIEQFDFRFRPELKRQVVLALPRSHLRGAGAHPHPDRGARPGQDDAGDLHRDQAGPVGLHGAVHHGADARQSVRPGDYERGAPAGAPPAAELRCVGAGRTRATCPPSRASGRPSTSSSPAGTSERPTLITSNKSLTDWARWCRTVAGGRDRRPDRAPRPGLLFEGALVASQGTLTRRPGQLDDGGWPCLTPRRVTMAVTISLPLLHAAIRAGRAAALLLGCLPSGRLAPSPSHRVATDPRPLASPDHRLRLPDLRDPLPRRATLPGLQHLRPSARSRVAPARTATNPSPSSISARTTPLPIADHASVRSSHPPRRRRSEWPTFISAPGPLAFRRSHTSSWTIP